MSCKYWYCRSLTSVTIPNSVTSIGGGAFRGCSGLTSINVDDGNTKYDSRNNCNAIIEKGTNTLLWGCRSTTIPNSVTSIGSSAFFGCSSLTSITIPDGVTSIGDDAFSGCNGLTSITIPNSVTSIGDDAFSGCNSLTSIKIPDGVTSIGNSAFYGCSGLNSVHISDLAAWCKIPFSYSSSNPLSYAQHLYLNGKEIKDMVIPKSVTRIGDYAFEGCSSLTSITIPDGVTSIGNSAFSDCSGLTSIKISDGVTSIGNSAFSNCSSLTSITIPDGVTSIGNTAFSDCSSLTSITIPDGVTSIGNYAFSGCSGLTSIKIPDGVTSIGASAFSGCSGLTSITIPDGVTSIGNSAFYGCSDLISITGPQKMNPNHFLGCNNIKSANIHIDDLASWCEIGYDSSWEKHLYINGKEIKDFVIPNNVTSIEWRSFSGCTGLTSITIPNSVTSIGDDAFSGCSGLTSITIPDGVTSIGASAFSGCSALISITGPQIMSQNHFYGCNNIKSANIHIDNLSSFCETGWDLLCERHLYVNGEEIKDLVIPNGVESIESNAFYGCSGLTSITIPDGVTSIGNAAFSRCSGVTAIKIGKGVKTIRESAFAYCTNLSDVYCYAEEYPYSFNGIFSDAPINLATLHVPAIHRSTYQSKFPWSSFKYIFLLEGGNADRCAKPTISLKDGKIVFESKTPDASFVAKYTPLNESAIKGNKMALPSRFRITVFTQKNGLLDSPPTSAEVEMSIGKYGDLTGDGRVNFADHAKMSEIILNYNQ